MPSLQTSVAAVTIPCAIKLWSRASGQGPCCWPWDAKNQDRSDISFPHRVFGQKPAPGLIQEWNPGAGALRANKTRQNKKLDWVAGRGARKAVGSEIASWRIMPSSVQEAGE